MRAACPSARDSAIPSRPRRSSFCSGHRARARARFFDPWPGWNGRKKGGFDLSRAPGWIRDPISGCLLRIGMSGTCPRTMHCSPPTRWQATSSMGSGICQRTSARRGCPKSWICFNCAGWNMPGRGSYQAANNSGSHWREPWPHALSCCCWMNRCPRWMGRPGSISGMNYGACSSNSRCRRSSSRMTGPKR